MLTAHYFVDHPKKDVLLSYRRQIRTGEPILPLSSWMFVSVLPHRSRSQRWTVAYCHLRMCYCALPPSKRTAHVSEYACLGYYSLRLREYSTCLQEYMFLRIHVSEGTAPVSERTYLVKPSMVSQPRVSASVANVPRRGQRLASGECPPVKTNILLSRHLSSSDLTPSSSPGSVSFIPQSHTSSLPTSVIITK